MEVAWNRVKKKVTLQSAIEVCEVRLMENMKEHA